MASIPSIDLSQGLIPSTVDQLRHACKEHGFFFLVGHGISLEEMNCVLAQSRQFFGLSIEDKMRCKANRHNRGYTRYGEETLDPKAQKSCGDTKEGFYMGREPDEDEVGKFVVLGKNEWPDAALVPQFRETMERYLKHMSDVGRQVTKLLALALGVDVTYFDAAFQRPVALVRLLHYAAERSDPERGIFAAGAHSDYGMVTLLLTDGEPGLQVWENDQWADVQAPPGAFVCNLGDMLERWSNSEFASTKHRVLNTTGRERYSVPFFFDPNFDTWVTSLPTCGVSKAEPIRSGDYLLSRYNDTHADFTTGP